MISSSITARAIPGRRSSTGEPLRAARFLGATLTEPSAKTRFDKILPILRCPVSKQKLAYDPDKVSLVSVDGIETVADRRRTPGPVARSALAGDQEP